MGNSVALYPLHLMSVFVDPTPTVRQIAYMLTITSAAKLKKAAAKRKPKTQNLCLNSDEPYDTFKAQILVKISTAIKLKNINFDNSSLQFPLLCMAGYSSLQGIIFSLLNIGGVMNSEEWGTYSLRLLVYRYL